MTVYLQADLAATYERFVRRVLAERRVWVAVNADMEGAACGSATPLVGDATVQLVFSARALAKRICKDNWADFQPMPISISAFVNGALAAFAQHGDWVGCDFNGDLVGPEVEAVRLRKDLGF